MAEKHELKITITDTGEIEIEVDGIKGSRCLDITKDIEEELGVVINREKKSEYYQDETNTDINSNIGE